MLLYIIQTFTASRCSTLFQDIWLKLIEKDQFCKHISLDLPRYNNTYCNV